MMITKLINRKALKHKNHNRKMTKMKKKKPNNLKILGKKINKMRNQKLKKQM